MSSNPSLCHLVKGVPQLTPRESGQAESRIPAGKTPNPANIWPGELPRKELAWSGQPHTMPRGGAIWNIPRPGHKPQRLVRTHHVCPSARQECLAPPLGFGPPPLLGPPRTDPGKSARCPGAVYSPRRYWECRPPKSRGGRGGRTRAQGGVSASRQGRDIS